MTLRPGQPPLWLWRLPLPQFVDVPQLQRFQPPSPYEPGGSWPGGPAGAAVHPAFSAPCPELQPQVDPGEAPVALLANLYDVILGYFWTTKANLATYSSYLDVPTGLILRVIRCHWQLKPGMASL